MPALLQLHGDWGSDGQKLLQVQFMQDAALLIVWLIYSAVREYAASVLECPQQWTEKHCHETASRNSLGQYGKDDGLAGLLFALAMIVLYILVWRDIRVKKETGTPQRPMYTMPITALHAHLCCCLIMLSANRTYWALIPLAANSIIQDIFLVARAVASDYLESHPHEQQNMFVKILGCLSVRLESTTLWFLSCCPCCRQTGETPHSA